MAPEPLSASAQRVQDALAALGCEGRLLQLPARRGRPRRPTSWQKVWAAGGHPNTVFSLAPHELARITGGCIVRVK